MDRSPGFSILQIAISTILDEQITHCQVSSGDSNMHWRKVVLFRILPIQINTLRNQIQNQFDILFFNGMKQHLDSK